MFDQFISDQEKWRMVNSISLGQILADCAPIWLIWKPYKPGFFELFSGFFKSCRGASCGRFCFRFCPQSCLFTTARRTAWKLRREGKTTRKRSINTCPQPRPASAVAPTAFRVRGACHRGGGRWYSCVIMSVYTYSSSEIDIKISIADLDKAKSETFCDRRPCMWYQFLL